MLDKNKVIALVRSKGPVLPVNITKDLNTSPIFAGAILSELVDNKQLRLSHAKIGGSPVYYVEGQEHKLPELLYKHLHEKERKSFDLLKSRGIIRDRDEEPVVRVALRAIKDFAIPFEVRKGNDVEIFWKFFMINDSDAEKRIRILLQPEIPAVQEEKKTSRNRKKQPKQAQKRKSSSKNSQKSKQKQKKSQSRKLSAKKSASTGKKKGSIRSQQKNSKHIRKQSGSSSKKKNKSQGQKRKKGRKK